MNTPNKQLIENINDERNAVYLYKALAEVEKNPQISEIYTHMAEVESRHAESWRKRLEENGVKIPAFRPTWRTQVLKWLAQRFGAELVLSSIVMMERDVNRKLAQKTPGQDPAVAIMAAEENSHARLMTQITRSAPRGIEGGALASLEGRHRASGGNALRAAVLGANDGLVSNLSLVMGVAGAALSNKSILITGIAGLLAGACSMALGEWLSVQSSRELYQHQIQIETEEIKLAPEQEAEELALIYQSRGVDKDQAQKMAFRIMEDRESAIDTLAREELGVNPKELGGSAWEAAITSFLLFALGAIVPVFSFIFLTGTAAVITSLVASTVGLFLIGAGITLFTGRPTLLSGARMVLFGLSAAAITFILGKLIGTSLAG